MFVGLVILTLIMVLDWFNYSGEVCPSYAVHLFSFQYCSCLVIFAAEFSLLYNIVSIITLVLLVYEQNFYTTTLCLAYQSLGIVYGDLSISPIYVYKSTFAHGLNLYAEDHEILGVLSMVFWTLTIIPLCKYIIFVLGADDNGEGAYSNLSYLIAACENIYWLIVVGH